MADNHQVVASFVIYSDEQIVVQGSFQVLATQSSITFASTDGKSFLFKHHYEDATCLIDVSYIESKTNSPSCNLKIPINRTKIKWKETDLGESYRLYYRSQYESTRKHER